MTAGEIHATDSEGDTFIVADADEGGRYCWLGPRPGVAQGKMTYKHLDLYLE